MKLLVDELFQPLASSGSPNLTSYVPVDIVRVWELGPIGYEGQCWRHEKLELYVVKLDGQQPWFAIVPAFGVSQLNRMLAASHKIDGLRLCGGGGRRTSGYARYWFEYRSSAAVTVVALEDNFDRNGLIVRCVPFALDDDEVSQHTRWDALYPESDKAKARE